MSSILRRSRGCDQCHQRHKERFPDVWSDTEGALNRLGYRLLGAGRVEDAITVFELNAGSYPDRANTWDSLGEAHLEAGHRERARTMYLRALELDPDNDNARRIVEKLESTGARSAQSTQP